MNKKFIITIAAVLAFMFIYNTNKQMGIALMFAALLYFVYRGLPTIYLFRANKSYFNKDYDKAMSLYEKACNLKNSTPSIKSTYAYILLKHGQVLKAEEILQKVMKLPLNQKDHINAVLNLSLVFWKSDRLPEAISLLEEQYNKGFKNTMLYQSLGFFYILSDDLEKALEFNLEAFDYNNSDASILDNLALNYYLLQDYTKALEIYEKLIPMNPSFVTAYYYYGLTLEKLQRFDEALEMLRKSLLCNFSFLSSVNKEQVQQEIDRIELNT
jgi:tetratricopeptide (TPR) repeat protein